MFVRVWRRFAPDAVLRNRVWGVCREGVIAPVSAWGACRPRLCCWLVRYGGERADAGERADEVVVPGPAGGEVQRPAAGGAGQAAGDLQQPAAEGAGGADGLVGEAEQGGPAQQVVRERGDHGPGAVGVELAGGEVRERLVFEVADRVLDDGVLAVLGLDERELARCGW